MKIFHLILGAALLFLTQAALAENCHLSGYDSQFDLGLYSDSDTTTVHTDIGARTSLPSSGAGIAFSYAWCVSNDPSRDVFINVFYNSIAGEQPANDGFYRTEYVGGRIGISFTLRR